MAAPSTPFVARGFSLIEVLVAFTITALLLGVFFQVLARGTRSSIAQDRYTRATLLAEAKMAEVGTLVPVSRSENSGVTEDGLAWERTIHPSPAEEVPFRDPAKPTGIDAPTLFDVDVTVRAVDRQGSAVSLHSRRLGIVAADLRQ